MDYLCCLMGICCAFGSPEQFESLVAMRIKSGACASRDAAEAVVTDDLKQAKAFIDAVKQKG
jgi:hypothetical protein